MPLDVRGCTRATLKESASDSPGSEELGNPSKFFRAWDRELQLFPLNEEFPVSAGHKLALITSLPFVHTARRYYRLDDFMRLLDCCECRFVGTRNGNLSEWYRLEEVKVVTRFP